MKIFRLRPLCVFGLFLALVCGAAERASASIYDYAGRVTFTVKGCASGAVEDFPVFIRVSEAAIPGFSYDFLRNETNDLVFLDSTGQTLPFEMVSWDIHGESDFWVKVPSVYDGATVTMCWNLRDGCTKPARSDASAVWSDYVGVWHMDEEITSETAETTYSADATGNGHSLAPRIGPEGVYTTMTSTGGVFGNARVNDTKVRNKKQGSYLEISNSSNLVFGGVFTLSFWLKVDACANYPHLASRRSSTSQQKGFQIDINISDRRQLVARGDTQTGGYNTIVDKPFTELGFTHLAFAYNCEPTANGTNVSIFANGVCKVDKMTIGTASDNGLPICIGNQNGGTEQSVWGKYDEIRLYKGVKSAAWIAAENDMGTNANFYAVGAVTNDATAVLQNEWESEPTVTKTVWEYGTQPQWEDFSIKPRHGTLDDVTVVIRDRSTGEEIGRGTGWDFGSALPSAPGSYRVDILLAEQDGWGALESTLDFQISANAGSHGFEGGESRILLVNDDYSVDDGAVEWQGYDDEDPDLGLPYWLHLDSDGHDASTTYSYYWSDSYDFNLGGGTHHIYCYGENTNDWWDLRDVRIGNTFNNGEILEERTGRIEEDDEGLQPEQNYLPWNPDAQSVLGHVTGEVIGPYHRYAGHIVMQNSENAAVVSPCYTNGIGTIYFDAVNGWTNNVWDAEGEPNYRLVVEVATQTKPDEFGEVHVPYVVYTSSNPGMGLGAPEPYRYADWTQVPMHVLRFDDGTCTDLGEQSALTLDIEDGGSYKHFFRVYVPVTNVTGNARFRIRRVAIDPLYELNPDGNAYILVDNVICSSPTKRIELEPYGEFFSKKTGKQVLGYEGAFDPPFPAITDTAVYGRAKATLDGRPVPPGILSSAAMHYRWHYLDQKTTDWKVADLSPSTLVSLKPLELPKFEGDVDFWFDANQSGNYYEYADYSGTGLGLAGKYSEAVPSVTNRQEGADWFVRMREGQSSYSEMKIVMKGASKAIVPVDMFVCEDNLWRGFVSTSNIIDGAAYWRIEPRNKQTDGAKEWNWSTNYWYVQEWDPSASKQPEFPAAGRMSEGTTNAWCQMPKDAVQTGYLMFQVDESSMGVTVVRSDYANFNDWNDSRKDYFVISSSGKKGSSATAQTYDEKYANWADTPSTNENWNLSFDHEIGESEFWTGYKTFASVENYFMAWQIGKGMWVHGKYREPASNIALQMAGCGEGYAEFSNETIIGGDWPRGIGEVSFKARIAQAVSPEYAAFYDGGYLKGMTNYAFMARTCFDQRNNRGFSGDASLSLFAYFRSGKGGYEARWEQIKGVVTDNPLYETEVLAPATNGQRLVISRWNAAGNSYVETELVATTNYLFSSWNVPMPMMSVSSSTNNLMPFVISAYNTASATYIVAAVRINKAGNPPAGGGVGPRAEVPNNYWYCVTYRDESSKRLKGGTYGVLSSNCEGMFVTPQFGDQPVWPEKMDGKDMSKMTDVGTWNAYAPMSLKNYNYSRFRAGSCAEDIADDWWTVSWDDPGRMEAFVDFDDPDANNFGFAYVPPFQTVDVYVKSRTSTGEWGSAPIGSIAIDGFGTPGSEPDYRTNLYCTTDCHLRLQTGGGLDDYRTDVAISDIVVGQWRGYDDWSSKEKETSAVQGRYGRTNIVFTTGWVTNGAVRLSARRSEAGKACSVRSPLFDGYDGRGIGLGRLDFTYRKPETSLPDSTVLLKVQIVTNYTWQSGTSLKDMSLSVAEGDGNQSSWHTLTNLTYAMLKNGVPKDQQYGHYSLSLGMHGVKGLMRVVVDNDLVKQVADVTDPTAFGEIDILEFMCKDEPSLDQGCWWGWNMQTIGDPFDQQRRMFLPDCTLDLEELGQSLALNNSTTVGVDPAESTADVKKHMPFVQSPTFTNAVIGQITFKARTYDQSPYAPAAKVYLYGAPSPLLDDFQVDSKWECVEAIPITNALYTTYTCKTDAKNYYALRLAVVLPDGETDDPPPEAKGVTNPQRVLIDEVSISEAVRAMLAFRNVGAFRSHLDDNSYVTGVTTRAEQPLCDENWGVQGELFATMLGEEILMDEQHPTKVRLHWYVGEEPWGFENWRKLPIDKENRTHGVAWLAQTEGSNLVFRSSYSEAPDAVMAAQTTPGTVVQYMLEVQYWTLNSTKEGAQPMPATNWLDSASWTVPEWYAPVDYNVDAEHGAGKTFSAFTILDTVAPGWAWINEMNIFGVRKTGGANSEQTQQFLEVCVPAEADLSGWKVRMLDAYLNGKVVTNNVATFGVGKLTGKKTVTTGMKYGKVFRSIGTKEGDGLKYADGSLDAPWTFSKPTGSFAKGDGYYYISDYEQPIGVQLLRPSGIIEHSIVVIGTNRWGRLPGTKAYDPTNFVAILNRSVPGSRFFYAGEDCCGAKRTDSVTSGQGESPSVWTNSWVLTPGFINHSVDGKEQTIGDHPSPHGDSIIVYASLNTAVGHISYRIGEGEVTTEPQMIILKRGSDVGTNITYYVSPWYELASVTTNGTPFWEYRRCVRETNMWVGVHASNNLYVVGTAQVDSDLAEKYGLTKDNPFTPAVMDWLEKGETLQKDADGNYKKFANPGNIHLADFVEYKSPVATNLTLTQMYCLDMDPTVGNLLLEAGYSQIGSVTRGTLENGQLTMFMMITNRNEGAEEPVAWSPYVLRGLAPGSHSWQFKNPDWTGETISSWTSETFKVTGIIFNGHTSQDNPANYIPLNWFVFHEDSFYQADDGEHKRFTAEIEVLDPHSQSSPGADSGWYEWCQKHPGTFFGWGWAIDMRSRPVGAEVLRPNNYWDE